MILSHHYRFLFVKTAKTAGTSLEVFLSSLCDKKDIVTPIIPPSQNHQPRNFCGLFNPLREFTEFGLITWRQTVGDLIHRRKFYNHISARRAQCRLPSDMWRRYYRFAVERNPYEKVLSLYNMLNYRCDGELKVDDFFRKGLYRRALNYPYYTDRAGQVIVDRVLRYEQLNEDLTEVFTALQIPFSGKLGIREKSNYRKERQSVVDKFNNRQLDLITEAYQKEIMMWNYSLELL